MPTSLSSVHPLDVRRVAPGAVGLPAAELVPVGLGALHHHPHLFVEIERLGRAAAGVRAPPEPRLGITNACITERSDLARRLTVSIVWAACSMGSGFVVSGDDGTTESTVAEVAESRKSSFR